MLRALSSRRRWASMASLLALALVGSACGGGGSKASDDGKDLVVMYFSHAGRTDVFRNQMVDIVFNVAVKTSSVSERSIRISGGPNGQTPARGRLLVNGNVVTFDPTLARVDLTNRTVFEPNPFGFEALSSFQLTVSADPNEPRVQNSLGEPINTEFFTSFQTNDEFVPELRQPLYVGNVSNGMPGELDFSPKPDPTTGLVDQAALIIIEFDEPIDPATMDAGVTVIVRNEDLSAQFGRDELIPGTFKSDLTATRWTFESSAGIGRGPFDDLGISVTLTPGIKDLAGNPLGNPQTLVFKTAEEPNVPNFSSRSESFSSTAQRDAANTTADWNGSVRGHLLGGAITKTTVDVMLGVADPSGTRTRLADILTSNTQGSHTQALYLAEELGLAGTLARVSWGPDSAALFAATHPRIIINVGQTIKENLVGTYASNFDVAGPVRVYDGEYTIPQNADITREPPLGINPFPANSPQFAAWPGYWPFPNFTTFFEYDGTNNLVLDFDTQAGTNFQIIRVFNGFSFSNPPPNGPAVSKRRLFGDGGAKTGSAPSTGQTNPEATVYDMSFEKSRRVTVAQSRFYNTSVKVPNYTTPIISPPSQQGGATFSLEFEGQDGMPNPANPFQIIPDPSTSTGWVTNINLMDGKQFFRFRFTLFANLISETVVDIDNLQVPFTFD